MPAARTSTDTGVVLHLAGVLRKRRRATCLQASMEVSGTHSSTLQESFGSGGERRASKPQWRYLVLTHLPCRSPSEAEESDMPPSPNGRIWFSLIYLAGILRKRRRATRLQASMDVSGSHSSTLQESFGSGGERRASKPQWTYLVLTHLPCRSPSEAEESDAPPSLNGRIWYSLIYLAGILRKRRRATRLQASMEVSGTHSSTLQESFGSEGERRPLSLNGRIWFSLIYLAGVLRKRRRATRLQASMEVSGTHSSTLQESFGSEGERRPLSLNGGIWYSLIYLAGVLRKRRRATRLQASMEVSGSHSSTLQESFGSGGERRASKPQWRYLVLTHLPCRNPSEAEESDAPPSLNGGIWYSLIYLAGILRKRRRATRLQAPMDVSGTHSSTLQESFGSGGEWRASKPQWRYLVLTHLPCRSPSEAKESDGL